MFVQVAIESPVDSRSIRMADICVTSAGISLIVSLSRAISSALASVFFSRLG